MHVVTIYVEKLAMLIKSFEITYIIRCTIPIARNGHKISHIRLLIAILLMTRKLEKIPNVQQKRI